MLYLPAGKMWKYTATCRKSDGCGDQFEVVLANVRKPQRKNSHFRVTCPNCGRSVIIARRALPKDYVQEVDRALSRKN